MGHSVALDNGRVAIGAFGGNAILSNRVRVYNLNGMLGRIYLDYDEDCIRDSLEIGVPERLL